MHEPSLEQFRQLAKDHDWVPVYRRILSDTLTPVSAFRRIDAGSCGCLFESVVGGERVGRYSFLTADPFLEVEAFDRRVVVRSAAGTEAFEAEDPLVEIQRRIESIRADIYKSLTPWQRVLVARHPNRPGLEDFIQRLFPGFIEIHGDRRFADDHAIMTGFAEYRGQSVLLVGHVKGRDTKEKIYRNFGMPRPEGYRKALRLMKLAEKFAVPVLTFIDTPGAYPGIGAEERGQSEAIGRNLYAMAQLRVPIVCTVIGEGGSGGALALGTADRILMFENSVYSVISPEGCAAILWRDGKQGAKAAEALRLSAQDQLALGIVDEVLPEPVGGAHRDWDATAATLSAALRENLARFDGVAPDELIRTRAERFRRIGVYHESTA